MQILRYAQDDISFDMNFRDTTLVLQLYFVQVVGMGRIPGPKQAAEKGQLLDRTHEKHPSAAKATLILGLYAGVKTPASLRAEIFRSL
jgi:hypothetical protein